MSSIAHLTFDKYLTAHNPHHLLTCVFEDCKYFFTKLIPKLCILFSSASCKETVSYPSKAGEREREIDTPVTTPHPSNTKGTSTSFSPFPPSLSSFSCTRVHRGREGERDGKVGGDAPIVSLGWGVETGVCIYNSVQHPPRQYEGYAPPPFTCVL